MTPKPTVSIVIPAFNEQEHIAACIDAISRQIVMPEEVIVVDNNCSDKTVEIAKRYNFVTIVKEAKQGVVHARNCGFDAANSAVIARIDSDALVPENWVEHLKDFYSNTNNYIYGWSGAGYFYNLRLPKIASFGYRLLAFQFNRLLTGHYTLWGSNMAITSDQWRQVKQSLCEDEDIHEDLDLAIHLTRYGYKVFYDPKIKTRAYLRRVQSERGELWGYLALWPETLRKHSFKSWVVCWFVGAFFVYLATFLWSILDKLASLDLKK